MVFHDARGDSSFRDARFRPSTLCGRFFLCQTTRAAVRVQDPIDDVIIFFRFSRHFQISDYVRVTPRYTNKHIFTLKTNITQHYLSLLGLTVFTRRRLTTIVTPNFSVKTKTVFLLLLLFFRP